MSRDNWDDLRFVLAAAEEGSVSGAARRLGVNHATALRRIAAFEAAAGTELFDKTARGYAVPADRARVIAAVREVERAVQVVARLLAGSRAPLTGEVRVTSTDSFCQVLLPPILARLAGEAPELTLSLISSNSHLDLGRTQADIAVRPTARLPEDLDGVRAGRLDFGLYGAAGRPEARPVWLGLLGTLDRTVPARWMAEHLGADQIGDGADSFMTLREMAALGLGLAVLPRYLGDGDSRLRPVPGLPPELSVDVWVACHADLASVPRIALTRRLLARALAEALPPAAEAA